MVMPCSRSARRPSVKSARFVSVSPIFIDEMQRSRHSERQGRMIDHDEEGSMELKKREGYF